MIHTPSTRRQTRAALPAGAILRRLVREYGVALFFAAHLLLALMLRQSQLVGQLHAYATLAAGLWLAVREQRLERVAFVVAYVVGAEVLWRMTGADIFWEFGKYAAATICLVAILRRRQWQGPTPMLVYFVILLPSTAMTVMNEEWSTAQQQISFSLSGPFALAVCAWFFFHLKLTRKQLRQLFAALIAPIIGVGIVALFGMLSNPDLNFGGGSNPGTSGGFGPNQVSGVLGLGVLTALLCALDERASRGLRVLMLLVMGYLAAQSALTFSRGGLFYATGSAVFASAYLIRDARSRLKFVLIAVLLFVVGNYVVLPRLDNLTDGALSARFQSIDPTHRDDILEDDLGAWIDNPIIGVGPGQREGRVAHTEFTRLLADHGSLGLLAIVLLLATGTRNLRRARTNKGRALAAAMMGWSCLFMLGYGMRLAAPSFAFGLTFVRLLAENPVRPRVRLRPAPKPEATELVALDARA